MVYDCFPFYNELDLLELRLHELKDVVDRHILVESRQTFQGREKPLWFDQNKARFEPFLDKITHLIVDLPEGTPFDREFFQRDAANSVLENCDDKDIIIIADVDEIISPTALRIYCDNPIQMPRAICQKVYYYWMNCLASDNCAAPVVMPFRQLKKFMGVTEARIKRDQFDRLYRGGWHFAYLGGVDAIIEKIGAFAHIEYNNPEFLDKNRLSKVLEDHGNLFSDKTCVIVPLDQTFPRYLTQNRDKFARYLK
jgi:beta-1,4-mannosyl-glycoprotein beta-1,4-N-acetylglucosaminyltransferase